MKLTINKYVLIGFVALAVLVVCLLRPRRESFGLETAVADSKVGQINNRLSMMEYKIADSESKRNKSNEDANVALGSSSGKLS
jgi:hypothetical protein